MKQSELRDGLNDLAERFATVEADGPETGGYYIERLMARAGKLAKLCNERSVLRDGDGAWVFPFDWPADPDDSASWAEHWETFCWGCLRMLVPDRFDRDIGCMRWRQTLGDLNVWEAEPSRSDWKQRSLDYAEACRLLASWCDDKPATRRPRSDSPSKTLIETVQSLKASGDYTWAQIRRQVRESDLIPDNKRQNKRYPSDEIMRQWCKEGPKHK